MDINQIYNIDCDQGMGLIDDDSIDIIFTDPPYIKECCEKAYCILAKHAYRILKPSGFLIMYSGQYYLDMIMNIFKDSNLEYFWLASQLNNDSKPIIWSRNAMAAFKPILIYQKPPLTPCNKLFMDVIHGKKSKKYHPWEQSIQDALYLIQKFANQGDLVLDPFTGSGTSLLAAKLLGMDYIGFEIDENTVEIARKRLCQEPLCIDSY